MVRHSSQGPVGRLDRHALLRRRVVALAEHARVEDDVRHSARISAASSRIRHCSSARSHSPSNHSRSGRKRATSSRDLGVAVGEVALPGRQVLVLGGTSA